VFLFHILAIGKHKAEGEPEPDKSQKVARIEPHMFNEPSVSGLSESNLEFKLSGPVISADYFLDIPSRVLKAARTLYNAMWGKSFRGILKTHGTSNYVPSIKLKELELSRLGFSETVLLLCQEYIKAFNTLHLESSMGDDDNVIITGHPGIGM
jgi:hypothetical protein